MTSRAKFSGSGRKISGRSSNVPPVEATLPYPSPVVDVMNRVSMTLFLAALGAAASAQEAPPAALKGEQAVAEFRAFVEERITSGAFSGSVAVGRNGDVLFQAAGGMASRAYQAPNKVDTKFNLASMGKMFTSVAIARYVQDGKLSYITPIGTYLPDYPDQTTRERVTLHHLLNHTSGVQDIFNAEFQDRRKDLLKTVDDFVRLFSGKPLLFQPGTKWRYSNGGFTLAGKVLEKVGGKPYWQIVKETVFDPAGMNDSGPFELDRDPQNLAMGYTMAGQPASLRNNMFLHPAKGSPAGGSYSTAPDMIRFAKALRGNALVSEDVFRRLITKQTADGMNSYGYGFSIDRVGNQTVVGHNGGFPGISTSFDMFLESGYDVVVLSNFDAGAVPIARKARSLFGNVSGS